jgi:hypothetical protein
VRRQAGGASRKGGVSTDDPTQNVQRQLMYSRAGGATVWDRQLAQFVQKETVAWISRKT